MVVFGGAGRLFSSIEEVAPVSDIYDAQRVVACSLRRMPIRSRQAVVLLAVTALVPSGCGGDTDRLASPATTAPDPAAVVTYAGMPSYRRRCEALNRLGGRARVLYEPREEMTRGDTETVAAAVTLNQSAPRDQVLRRLGAAEEPGVVVSCRLQAQLNASPYQFEVNEQGWVERSLLTAETVRWSWYVTSKIGGTHALVLNLRPIVRVRPRASTTEADVSVEDSNVQQYETSVHVNVPWTERPQEIMSRLAATFKIAESLVQALTFFVVAAVSLGAALGVRRRKKRARS